MSECKRSTTQEVILPFYQPIVSLQTRLIYGYESLGRRITANGIESLGPLFHSTIVKEQEKLELDRQLRTLALQHRAQSGGSEKLFINLKPSWIYRYHSKLSELPTLKLLNDSGIDPHLVVIEITEEQFTGDLAILREIMHVYRSLGCMIAIDDLGSGFSNFERIAQIEPDILKVDLNIIRKSQVSKRHSQLLKSFSSVAEHIGASLLLEGIESEQDIYLALQAGARYLQGFYFSQAIPDFLAESAFTMQLATLTKRYFEQSYIARHDLYRIESELAACVNTSLRDWQGSWEEVNRFLLYLSSQIHPICFRMYVCKENGDQVSANCTRQIDHTWLLEFDHVGQNWMWRSHFISNIVTMKKYQIGILSAEYGDLHSNRRIRTYSCPLNQHQYLFLDLDIEMI
ncbi:EAL domain-containing protein [Sulfoacidibacillus thermotolerans]|uniref:EAL domain-containing protein n=1 Tax=Sulfoacidibacillus thermotolerans TaxID=1765684 RepID=A0A2U3DCR9_SULT2|nr:EAL domain-containing protein [Sulfoacidibacillus thermotolerans]PWI59079.1 hypothetical protein BM613_00255 [Sulfoacidibacillus thermotolerans]